MITTKSNQQQQQQQHKNKKILMFLSENREINSYLNNYVNKNTGDQNQDNQVLKGFCEVKTQFANEVNSDTNKLVIKEDF